MKSIAEHLKKFCGRAERGFLGFGEASAKEQVQSNPVTEPKRSQNPKRPLSIFSQPHGYRISLNALVFLAAAIFAAGPMTGHTQTNSPGAALNADEKEKAAVEKHLKPVLEALKLQDSAKEATVRNVMSEFFAAHNTWHQANDSKLKGLWNDFNHARSKQDKAAADKALVDIDAVYATFKPQHEKMIQDLSSVLSPVQIETVEDTLTVNKVKVTYNVYLQIFPKLTTEQKAIVLKDLQDAREQAVDAGSMAEKSAFFKKYKIKIEEDYLTAQGYNPKQARKDFAAKGKTTDANDSAK